MWATKLNRIYSKLKIREWLPTLIVILVVGEGVLDPLTPRGISDWMFFVVPIVLSGWTEKEMTVYVAATASIFTVIGFMLSPITIPVTPTGLRYSIINRVIGIAIFWLLAGLVILRRKAIQKLRQAHASLEEQAHELLEAEKLKIQFLADSSHELRTPLAIMRSWTDLALGKKSRTLTDPRRALKHINSEVKHMSQVITNLTLLAKSDNTPHPTLALSTFSLDKLLAQVISKHRVLAPRITIQANFDSPVVYTGDRDKLEKLFTNLLTNAIRYGKKSGRIVVSMHNGWKNVSVAVRDDGVGIPEGDLQYIFERFYRVEKTRTSDGVGLGLSICKSIVEAHRGSIAVSSKEGEGSTFTVNLPLNPALFAA